MMCQVHPTDVVIHYLCMQNPIGMLSTAGSLAHFGQSPQCPCWPAIMIEGTNRTDWRYVDVVCAKGDSVHYPLAPGGDQFVLSSGW